MHCENSSIDGDRKDFSGEVGQITMCEFFLPKGHSVFLLDGQSKVCLFNV